jgi:membrane protease YdiL (CAAX protease family)
MVEPLEEPPTQSPAEILPWGFADIFKAILLIVVGMVGLGVVAAIITRLLEIDPDSVAGMSSPLLFGLGMGAYLLVLLAVYLFAVRRANSSWHALGVRSFGQGWWLALIVIYPIQLTLLAAVNTLLVPFLTGGEFENPQIEAITGGMNLDMSDFILLLLLIAVLAPIAEELLFRGMLYPMLRQRFGMTAAIVLDALIFAAIHFIPVLLPGLFVIGLVLTWVRERSGSVIPGILLHAAQNGLVVLLLYFVTEMPTQ